MTSANFAELRKKEEERQLSCGQYSATCQNSAIFSQSFCPIKNILASSTAAGDLIIHVGLNPSGRRGATFKNDKVSLCNEFGSINIAIKTNTMISIIILNACNLFQHMQQRRCPIYRTEVKYSGNSPYLTFVDMPLEDLSKVPSKEREKQRSDELMPQEHLTPTDNLPYPLAQINIVNLNPNLRSASWIFSGNQSGIGRLNMVKAVT